MLGAVSSYINTEPRAWEGVSLHPFHMVSEPGFTKPVGIGPVPVSAGTQPAKIQNLNLNSKNEKFLKKFLKILQGVMNLMVSNFLKNSFI